MRLIFILSTFFTATLLSAEETLPPLNGKPAASTVEEMWAGFDPRKEPMEVEVLKEWEKDGVVIKVIRYRIGIFKGKKAMMAAVYGYPKGAKKLPALVNIHGGGQRADENAIIANAKLGYATISIAWAGRINSSQYTVLTPEVKLFWAGKTEDKRYRITTDWGALDGYHHPSRDPKNLFPRIHVSDWTLDSVRSPRNNSWFLCALGARRALTFLERQPQVDASKLGVYGHSMGGKLTVMTVAADKRVKAAVPSCGGISDHENQDPMFKNTINDKAHLSRITCPIFLLTPSNDFHGRIDDIPSALEHIKSKHWRVSHGAHFNHQDPPEHMVNTILWMEQHLKGTFTLPTTPQGKLTLKTKSNTPEYTFTVDESREIKSINVYYTQQGQIDGKRYHHGNTIHRFWHHVKPNKNPDGSYTAALPVFSSDMPVWVYANVEYKLKSPLKGASYYYAIYQASTYTLSSPLQTALPAQLKAANVKATLKPTTTIDSFTGDWQKDWFNPQATWGLITNKLYHPIYKAPTGGKNHANLSIEVKAAQPNKLIISLDDHATSFDITTPNKWQKITLSPADFKNTESVPLKNWDNIRQFRLNSVMHLRNRKLNKTITLGGRWKGAQPQFRNLRWETSE